MDTLDRLTIKGFKSIKDATIEFRPLNVLIGANGAGKSNLISFFKMLDEMMAGRLQQYVAVSGRAQSLLHYGPKTTRTMEMVLWFRASGRTFLYRAALSHAAGDELAFAEETLGFRKDANPQFEPQTNFRSGHRETRIPGEIIMQGSLRAQGADYLLDRRPRVYHFQDTSSTARVRQYCYVGDNRWLLSDAGNLAAVLYRLRTENGPVYRWIVEVVRLIAPFFDDFDLALAPERHDVILNWRERGSDQLFGPHQLSDGTLRAICLVTLLLQPEERQPNLIVVDEPELGLHPYALNIVADLFKKAAVKKQILVSTQSSAFLDNFEPEDVIVVDRGEEGSTFTRLDAEALEAWLEEYSLGEIWEKNVVSGGPH